MQNKRILITGAAGFIGSHLAAYLADENEVIAVDDGSFGITENIPDSVDFHDRSTLEENLPTDVDIVYHFADISAYTVHEQDRRRGLQVSVEGFVNVVEQSITDGCSTVIYPSTGSLYTEREKPVTEDSKIIPTSAVQAAIAAREKYAEYFTEHFGLNMAGVRLFSVYHGHREGSRLDLEYPNIVTQIADAIAHTRPPILYGDGSEKRDFIHIDDVVQGLVSIGHYQLTGIYNLGSGRPVSLNELVTMIANELQMEVEPQYIQTVAPEVTSNQGGIADYTKINEEIGWEPQISLEEGIEHICLNYEVTEL